jgi:hypothetical protein
MIYKDIPVPYTDVPVKVRKSRSLTHSLRKHNFKFETLQTPVQPNTVSAHSLSLSLLHSSQIATHHQPQMVVRENWEINCKEFPNLFTISVYSHNLIIITIIIYIIN